MPSLWSTERRLVKDPGCTAADDGEIQRLVESGFVIELDPATLTQEEESWYTTHHMVILTGQKRVLYQFLGQTCNKLERPFCASKLRDYGGY